MFALTNPNRVFVELPDVRFLLPPHPGDAPIGLIKSFRGGLAGADKARVVVDVTGPVIVAKSVVEKNKDGTAKLVLEIVPASSVTDAKLANARRQLMQAGAAALGASSIQPPMPRPAISPQQRALIMYKPVIVIDPGHGGDDTGARKNGAVEKDVVLAFSLKLREKLAATGRYKVLMTRESDVFVELNARREFAERHMASLFVAVHADYAQPKARGATIYSLREGVANSLQRSAKGEVSANLLSDNQIAAVKHSDGDVGVVREILADLARREVDHNRDRTSVFVKSVIEYMGESTSLKDNPDRSAAFVVIKSAKVPLDPDRARLRHQRGGRRAPEIRRLAREGDGLHRHGHRQLFQPPGRPPADVTARRSGCRWPGFSGRESPAVVAAAPAHKRDRCCPAVIQAIAYSFAIACYSAT